MPQISVLLPGFNGSNNLSEAFACVASQSRGPFEIIVVDDGSTDNSRDVIKSYGKQILPMFKQNGGQASAMNAGFRQSHGEIVIFLDADDMLLPNVVQEVIRAFQSHPNVAKVMYRMEVIDAAGRLTGALACLPRRARLDRRSPANSPAPPDHAR